MATAELDLISPTLPASEFVQVQSRQDRAEADQAPAPLPVACDRDWPQAVTIDEGQTFVEPTWDVRTAQRLMAETLERVAAAFPADYQFDRDEAVWDCLDAQVAAARSAEDPVAFAQALDTYEQEAQQLFARFVAELEAARLEDLAAWFESLPTARP